MIKFTNMPPQIAALPRDSRGYPIPWFVATVNGRPDFRVASPVKLSAAVQFGLCWVCGQELQQESMTFVIGPMCMINRTSAEPPSHFDCARFSAINCPFLSDPDMIRREHALPEGTTCAGEQIKRNPGVTLLYTVGSYDLFPDGRGGMLFTFPDPKRTLWFCRGREATRAEVQHSIDTGLPLLKDMADKDPDPTGANAELERLIARAAKYLPKH